MALLSVTIRYEFEFHDGKPSFGLSVYYHSTGPKLIHRVFALVPTAKFDPQNNQQSGCSLVPSGQPPYTSRHLYGGLECLSYDSFCLYMHKHSQSRHERRMSVYIESKKLRHIIISILYLTVMQVFVGEDLTHHATVGSYQYNLVYSLYHPHVLAIPMISWVQC